VSEPLVVTTPDGARLAGERWAAPAAGPPVVLLHAGVADRRGWRAVAEALAAAGREVVAYDRRGFGETPPPAPGAPPFSHLDDLLAVLDAVAQDGPAVLVGNSMGGALALDLAIAAPGRVAALVLVAPAVSGGPEPDPAALDPATRAVVEDLEAADAAGDRDALNRAEVRLWLDGPGAPEGRVGGEARALALAMNGRALEHGLPEGAGDPGVDAHAALERVAAPTLVVLGELDVPWSNERALEAAARIPGARTRTLGGVAHLPGLERPGELAALVLEAAG
jgi:pimeloyl-ACP methyl ester carboxylesterase